MCWIRNRFVRELIFNQIMTPWIGIKSWENRKTHTPVVQHLAELCCVGTTSSLKVTIHVWRSRQVSEVRGQRPQVSGRSPSACVRARWWRATAAGPSGGSARRWGRRTAPPDTPRTPPRSPAQRHETNSHINPHLVLLHRVTKQTHTCQTPPCSPTKRYKTNAHIKLHPVLLQRDLKQTHIKHTVHQTPPCSPTKRYKTSAPIKLQPLDRSKNQIVVEICK